VESHQKFKEKFSLPYQLLADPGSKVCQLYGVWKEKSMYGRTYMGVERTTFLIDEKGKIARIFPKVKVEGHADELLAQMASISVWYNPLIEHLLSIDRSIFLAINGFHNPAMDVFMSLVTQFGDAKILVPLAIVAFVLTFKKRTWPIFLVVGITLLISDPSAHGIKLIVRRVRPSHALNDVHLVLDAGGRYGFPSNHATNAFAAATVLGWIFKRWRKWLLALAGLIGYSRIYVGVHYPGDVLGGTLLGSCTGWLVVLLYCRMARCYPRLALTVPEQSFSKSPVNDRGHVAT
jgi:undecaprenyl-diphosphatase